MSASVKEREKIHTSENTLYMSNSASGATPVSLREVSARRCSDGDHGDEPVTVCRYNACHMCTVTVEVHRVVVRVFREMFLIVCVPCANQFSNLIRKRPT